MPFYSVLADVLGFQRPSEFNIAQDVEILSKVGLQKHSFMVRYRALRGLSCWYEHLQILSLITKGFVHSAILGSSLYLL
jgi:hypothetical protein